jgi:2,2-dialkylglycine decarboxylase (pyruvate)
MPKPDEPIRDDDQWWEAGDRHLLRYGGEFIRFLVDRAEGARLYGRDGRTVLDFTSGQMCAVLGHNHPALTEAMRAASDRVVHLFSGMVSTDVIEFAEELAATLPDTLQKVMLLSTGAESNEAALRLAKLHTGGFEVVAFSGSWHGMTGGTASVTYSAGHQGYGPAMPGSMALPTPNAYHCPIRHCRDRCDLTCLDAGIELIDAQGVGAPAAVIVEPVLSSGGIVPLPDGYFPRLTELAHDRGYLVVLDEAQTALGRLGALYAFQQLDAVPDILTLSKTLGGGLPVAATVTGDEIEADCAAKGFLHYTSHVSDPLAARVALSVLREVLAEHLAERAADMGRRLRGQLDELAERYEAIGDVRGRGLLLGAELVSDRETRRPAPAYGAAVTARCLDLGLNVNIVKLPGLSSVLRLAPPLTITEAELDEGVEILDRALKETPMS